MSRIIIVSDLHIDTWTDRIIGATGKTRAEHFFDFLDWCEQTKIRELVINGDLMDFPPYSGQCAFPMGASISRDVIERLVRFASKIKVTYVYGNHDIGISGFRSMGEDNISSLRNVNFCYPDYLIDDYIDSTILIEHGHFCDPFILLYLKDLSNRTYISSKFESYNWAMQKRNPDGLVIQSEPGVVHEPIDLKKGQNAYMAAKQAQQPIRRTSLLRRLWHKITAWGAAASAKPAMEHWWEKAIENIDRYAQDALKEGRPVKQTIYQIYGHTHRADPREPRLLADGVSAIYINSGTWSEIADQGWYLDVDENGKVWLQEWINETDEMKHL